MSFVVTKNPSLSPKQLANSTEQKVAVVFQNVDFSYVFGKKIIHNLSFEIKQGEYVCIIGHNGSGKSTISKLLIGLLKANSGKIKIHGQILNLNNLKAILDRIGLIFQNPDNQFIGLTTKDDIAFGLENRKVPSNVIHKIINGVSEITGINDLMEKNAAELSGGQKQKVAITSILAINPDVILFDEATSMLDPKSKLEVKQLMRTLSSENQKTVISITHDMEELTNCDRILVMKNGKLVANTTTKQLFAYPKFILSCNLKLPFNVNLSYYLNKLGLKVHSTNDPQKLVEQIIAKGNSHE